MAIGTLVCGYSKILKLQIATYRIKRILSSFGFYISRKLLLLSLFTHSCWWAFLPFLSEAKQLKMGTYRTPSLYSKSIIWCHLNRITSNYKEAFIDKTVPTPSRWGCFDETEVVFLIVFRTSALVSSASTFSRTWTFSRCLVSLPTTAIRVESDRTFTAWDVAVEVTGRVSTIS